MSTATQSWVNERLIPLERQLQAAKDELTEVNNKFASRDADLANAERRFEELAQQMKSLEDKMEKIIDCANNPFSDTGGHRDYNKAQGILRNPGLRNLTAYAGDHRLYK